MSMSTPPGNEPSNAEIKSLLVEHIRASGDRDARTRETLGALQEQVRTLSNAQLEDRQRLGRFERDLETAQKQARKALDSGADLEGAVVVHVSKLETKLQDVVDEVSLVKGSTAAQDIVLDNQNRTLADQSKSLQTLLTQIGTLVAVGRTLPALVGVAAVLLGGFIWLVQHAH